MATLVREAARIDRLAPLRDAIRSILVHVQPEAEAEPRLQAAAELARRLDATLCGLGAEMVPSLAASDPYGLLAGEFTTLVQGQIEANLRNAETAFRRAATGLSYEWTPIEDEPVQAMARLARAADLIVAGGSPLGYRDGARWCDPASLVVLSGRPVLIAPPGGGVLKGEAVVVAWKDTREARRALADALPFLRAAEQVLVLELCHKDELSDADYRTFSVAEGLRRHGVEARARAETCAPEAVAGELNTQAAGIGADLIVAGAYGHTRLGEWAFGGVTRDLLQYPERFLLLSH